MATRVSGGLRRGYALVLFNPNDCAEDTTLRNMDGSWAFRNTRFFPSYPGYDWGILAAGRGVHRASPTISRQDTSIDKSKLIITGASRNGKAAMIAAAFDDRLMGAPVVTGGGGMGAYRFAGPRGSETLDIMQLKYPNWFSPSLRQFRGQREKLPFDQHWFLALAAPRPFIALEGDTDRISLPEAVRQSILGAKPAYALFGAEIVLASITHTTATRSPRTIGRPCWIFLTCICVASGSRAPSTDFRRRQSSTRLPRNLKYVCPASAGLLSLRRGRGIGTLTSGTAKQQ